MKLLVLVKYCMSSMELLLYLHTIRIYEKKKKPHTHNKNRPMITYSKIDWQERKHNFKCEKQKLFFERNKKWNKKYFGEHVKR